MKKTAMQEHIEWLKATIEIAEEQAPILVSSLKLCLGDATQKLVLEKQQIINAFLEGCSDNNNDGFEYYHETFKSE